MGEIRRSGKVISSDVSVVVKVEIVHLLNKKGDLDNGKFDRLARVISGLRNMGIRVVVVSSGAIYLGSRISGIRPYNLTVQQALAAIGQVRLMELYQQFFGEYNQMVAQILITADVTNDPVRNRNACNTLNNLLSRGVIPVVNENDALSTEDIVLDDNYYLVLRVAGLIRPRFIVVHTASPGKYLIIWGEEKNEYGMEQETHVAMRIGMLKDDLPAGPVFFPSRLPEF
ncbi:MAG TPA: hypothetical protein ENN63_01475 [Bacteroidetes bacterium]|nr:hypothetical protein [Bacteroidota bacterium]